MKKCNKCHETKPLTEYHKSSRHKDGHKAVCKKCRSISAAARYKKQHPPKEIHGLQYTTKQFIEKATKKHKGTFDYTKTIYKGTKNKIEVICPKHGPFVTTAWYHLAKEHGGCRSCINEIISTKATKPKSKFLKQAHQVHNKKYDYNQVCYINGQTKIKIICPTHGVFIQLPSAHLAGKGCPRCGLNKISSINLGNVSEFVCKAIAIHGDRYNYSQVKYNGRQIKVTILCPKHGPFKQTPAIHLAGSGCPRCGIISKGELIIDTYLTKHLIEYEVQKSFKDCKDVYPLKFDFYLPKQNLVIEYDGIQHFKPINRFGGIEAFKRIKHRDKIKTDFCQFNDIKLLRIPYVKLKQIPQILGNYLA